MSFDPADPDRRKQPRKFVTRTSEPKIRRTRTHWLKLHRKRGCIGKNSGTTLCFESSHCTLKV